MASPEWGEGATEPQEPEGDGNVVPEQCPNPTAPQTGKQLPHKMPHKHPPHPRVSSQHTLTASQMLEVPSRPPQSQLDFVGDPK